MANELITRNGLKSLGNVDITGNASMTGSLTAASKSFDIPHPTKDGYRINYGCLEGPEHGIYYRGRTNSNIIELPDYWQDLVKEETITVHLTPIGPPKIITVNKIENNKIYLFSEDNVIDTFFIIHAERNDVPPVLRVYKQL